MVIKHSVIAGVEALGFLVNYPNSHLEPSHIIDFLGYTVDSLKRELRLPQAKLTKIRQEAHSLLRRAYKYHQKQDKISFGGSTISTSGTERNQCKRN